MGIKEDIDKIKRRRGWSHEKFMEKKVKSYEYLAKKEKDVFSDGAIPGKYKDMIALGIAIIGGCESCMQFHIEDAIRKGASEQEILEVIDLAIFEGGSIAVIPARFALEVLEYVENKTK
jgi:AhpD family alkylhydroperoxidase